MWMGMRMRMRMRMRRMRRKRISLQSRIKRRMPRMLLRNRRGPLYHTEKKIMNH